MKVSELKNKEWKVAQQVITYDAEYANEVMKEIPLGYINKSICGCGLTTVALENAVDTIIAVPTINLVVNKVAQYPNERSTRELLAVYGETPYEEIVAYVQKQITLNNPVKIMVTYDSLSKVKFVLDKIPTSILVIDESNRLLTTTELKTNSKESSKSTDAISRLMTIAEEYKERVSFISATPIPLDYMPQWVRFLPNIKLEWKNTIKAVPYIMERGFVTKALREEIILPLLDNESITIEGLTFSKVVVFINSVVAINDIIKKCNLPLEDVRVVVGDSLSNDMKLPKKIKRLDYEENRKTGSLTKYTFITSSAFDGIDLYDEDAISVVVSNSTKSFQMLDIATDLKQAIARIRTKSNPNYGKYIYLYNQSVFDKSEEDLLEAISGVQHKLGKSISLYEVAKETDLLEGWMEDEDFIGYTIYNPETDSYTLNEMRFEADKYYLLEVRNQYKLGFDMRGSLEDAVEVEPIEIEYIEFGDMVKHFNAQTDKANVSWGRYAGKTNWIECIQRAYKILGKVTTDYDRLVKAIEAVESTPSALNTEVRSSFSVGQEYSRNDVKTKLQKIYNKLGINRKAKWNDLDEIMTVKHKKVSGERVVEVLSKK